MFASSFLVNCRRLFLIGKALIGEVCQSEATEIEIESVIEEGTTTGLVTAIANAIEIGTEIDVRARARGLKSQTILAIEIIGTEIEEIVAEITETETEIVVET